jgi:hypothetical protein
MEEGGGDGFLVVPAQAWADLAGDLQELHAGVVRLVHRYEHPTGDLPEHWFDGLRELASGVTKRPPPDAEVAAIRERARQRIELDNAAKPMPPDVRRFAEAFLGLLDHWIAGTATINELAAAAWFMRRAIPWRAHAGYPDDDPALRDALADLLARMAAAMLSITEGQTAG